VATKGSCRNTAQTTGISPAVDAGWGASASNFARCLFSVTRPGSDALTTVTVTETDSTDRNICVRQYIMPLKKGQTITGAQAVQFVAKFTETTSNNNMNSAFGIRVIHQDGTVKKTVLAVTREAAEFDVGTPGTLESRNNTATSAATNYTTVAGDYLVVEIGAGGDPSASNPHSYNISLGDNAATDLDASDVDTGADNPWFQLADTLIFEYSVDLPVLSSTTVNAPSVAQTVTVALISSTVVTAPSVAPELNLPLISATTVNQPTVAHEINTALISTTQMFAPSTALNLSLPFIEPFSTVASGLSDTGSLSMRAGSFVAISHSFTGDGTKLARVKFRLSKTGSPTGNVTCELRAHSGTFGSSSVPTGSSLDTSTTTIDSSTLSPTPEEKQFLFSQAVTLVNGTHYTVVILFGGGSSGNTVDVRGGNGVSGNLATSTGGSFTPNASDLWHTIESAIGVNAPSVSYVAELPLISATQLFAMTVAQDGGGGDQSVTGASISTTLVNAPSVAHEVNNGTIAGTTLYSLTVAYAVTTGTIESGNTLTAPVIAYAVTPGTISGTVLYALTVSPGAVTLVNGTISATTVSAPTVSTADTVVLPAIGPTGQLFAMSTAYGVGLAVISTTALSAPATAYQVNVGTIASTLLYAPTAGELVQATVTVSDAEVNHVALSDAVINQCALSDALVVGGLSLSDSAVNNVAVSDSSI
jgi:hypothetical protein